MINRDDDIPECICCGKEFPELIPTKIEGAVIDVCDRCAKYGTKVEASRPSTYMERKMARINELEKHEMVLSSDYGRLIVTVRESKGLTRDDLAEKINEKESVVKRIEDQELKPDEALIKKIEDFLDIRLRESYGDIVLQKRERKKIDMTVGDVVEVR